MDDNSYVIDVLIEIPKNSHIKYEYDKNNNAIRCDRILHTPFTYCFNYGFIPNTLSGDGDPLDVAVVMEYELLPGSYIKCKILGYLETTDDDGVDPKIIACPISKIDPSFKNINNIHDLREHTLDKIKYFFTHYKDLENKKVIVGDYLDRSSALQVYQESVTNFSKKK